MWYFLAFGAGLILGLVYNHARVKDLKRRKDSARAVSSLLIRRERKRRNEGRKKYEDSGDA